MVWQHDPFFGIALLTAGISGLASYTGPLGFQDASFEELPNQQARGVAVRQTLSELGSHTSHTLEGLFLRTQTAQCL